MESIDLNKIPVQETEGHTSKGNQLKWKTVKKVPKNKK